MRKDPCGMTSEVNECAGRRNQFSDRDHPPAQLEPSLCLCSHFLSAPYHLHERARRAATHSTSRDNPSSASQTAPSPTPTSISFTQPLCPCHAVFLPMAPFLLQLFRPLPFPGASIKSSPPRRRLSVWANSALQPLFSRALESFTDGYPLRLNHPASLPNTGQLTQWQPGPAETLSPSSPRAFPTALLSQGSYKPIDADLLPTSTLRVRAGH